MPITFCQRSLSSTNLPVDDLSNGTLDDSNFSQVISNSHRCRDTLKFRLYATAGIDRSTRAVSLRSDRGSRAFPSLDLDTVIEERSDPEQSTALELSSPD